MSTKPTKILWILITLLDLLPTNGKAQLMVDAGKDTTFCTGQNIHSLILGTTAKIENGFPPYSIVWECKIPKGGYSFFTASDLLSDTTILSPYFLYNPIHVKRIKFILHITDSENKYAKDSIFIRFSKFGYLTGGGQTRFYIEKGDSILLNFNSFGIFGGISPLTYHWSPKTYLSEPDSVNTWCKPDSSIQYEVVAIDSCGCVSYPELAYDIRVLSKNPSHEYQMVYSNRIALFENSEKQIKALRIDSVKADADSVFYPFATIQEVSKNCFSPYKASWIGEKVVVKPDGINLFFNRDGDTIMLKTRARIKETWIAFQSADNFRVKATVQSIELVNFLGLADSVKTITLTVTDLNENTVNHALNKLKVKISKTYGFIETLNFYLFPDITVRYPNDRLEVYSLVGLTNPKVGVQNLTWFEVNDFQVGDELHVQEHNLGDPYFFLPIREYDNRCIYKYLERTDYADSIVYRYARKQSIKTVYTDSTTFETYSDTLKSVVPANPGFDKLPAEPIIEDFSAYQLYMRNEEYRMKIDLSMTERYSGSGNCLSVITGEGCFYEKKFIDGLGGPYYNCGGYVGDSEERKLVYYKKGETEWGEKLVITGVTDIKTGDDLKVFPNPADNYITISNPSNIKIKKIELINFSGRIVQLWNATECAGNSLNIQHISPGIYLLKAETYAGIKTEKLVVQ
jgi:hypothetical protein